MPAPTHTTRRASEYRTSLHRALRRTRRGDIGCLGLVLIVVLLAAVYVATRPDGPRPSFEEALVAGAKMAWAYAVRLIAEIRAWLATIPWDRLRG